MKYGFVIPTYNNKYLLKNTLEALNYQNNYSENDYEVIVVDDGSTDNTSCYIKNINKNYNLKYIYLERTKDSCRAKTRNQGWKSSEAEIIIFIDSDIIVKENYLEELDRCFSINKDILVIGNRLMLGESYTTDDIINKKIFKNNVFDSENFNLLEFRHFLYEILSYNPNVNLYNWMQVYSCNMAILKKHLEKIGGFDENFKFWGLEDVELGYSLIKNGVQLIINSKLEVLHQYHGSRNDLAITEEKISGYKKNIDYFLAKHPNALTNVNKRLIYKFFTGDLPVDTMLLSLLNMGYEIVKINFIDHSQLMDIKSNILNIDSKKKIKVVINDYIEDTDLDLWIQLLGKTKYEIKYYPMSKRIDNKSLSKFLKMERAKKKYNEFN